MIQNYYDYLYTKQLKLDYNQIEHSCGIFYKFIENTFLKYKSNINSSMNNVVAPETTKAFEIYNLFMYNLPGFFELFKDVKNTFRELSQSTEPAYIQSWLNVYNKGDFVDWHNHWEAGKDVWHGFYCVNVEPNSYTSYKLPFLNNQIDIQSKNGLLVIGKSEDDYHRSSQWTEDYPRITIAFDIVPKRNVDPFRTINHWIPLT